LEGLDVTKHKPTNIDMKQKLKIAEPCHENWNEMTPIEQGKHCEVCSKKVVDFTKESRAEIINYLGEAEGQTCGRFKATQIDIYGEEKKLKNKTIAPIYKAAAASILALLGIGSNGAVAQDGVPFFMGEVAYEPIVEVITNSKEVVLDGEIKSQNVLLANAKVSIYSGGNLIKSIITKPDGKYRFVIEKGTLINNHYTLKVFAAGFESKIVDELNAYKAEITMDIAMEHEMMIMGKIMIQPDPADEKKPKIKEEKIDVNKKKEVFYKGNVSVVDPRPLEGVRPVQGSDTLQKKEKNEIKNTGVDTPGNSKTEEFQITVFPNPSQFQVFVRTNKKSTYEYGVTDLNGKLLFSGTKTGETFELNFAGKPNGIYLISIYQNGVSIETKRVVISH